jgi:hypothetical protein
MRRMALLAGIGLLALGVSTAAGVPSVAGAATLPLFKAEAICNKAVLADKPITTKQVAACKVASGYITTKCSHAPNVYEVSVGTNGNGSALLRVSHKPKVYTEANLTVSDGTQLCGDPLDPTDTPPPAAMTQAQVAALFRKPKASTTTTSAGTTASNACAQWVAANNALAGLPAGMTMAQAETKMANLCSPSEMNGVLAASQPSDPSTEIQLATKSLQAQVCPTNPHTKLCP